MAKRRGAEPLRAEEKRSLNKSNFKKLIGVFRYVLPYRSTLIIGMVFLVLSNASLLTFPYFAGKLIGAATGEIHPLWGGVNQVALILLGILFFQSVFSFGRVYMFAQVSERSMAAIRTSFYSNMIRLPMAFFDKNRVGELTSRLTSDVTQLQDTLSVSLAELIRQVTVVVGGIVLIAIISPRLTLFMIAVFPVVVLAALFFGKFIRKISRQTQDELALANVVAEETLQAIHVVKAFTNEVFETHRYRTAIERVIGMALKNAAYRGMFISFIIFALFGSIVSIIWFGATLVQDGLLQVDNLFSFVLYTALIGGSIAGLGDIMSQLQRAIGASERVLEIIGEKSEPLSPHTDPLHLEGEVIFEKIEFSYPNHPVFTELTLHVKKGQKVALVGQSGSGKSTLIQLLLQFYTPQNGSIKVDGKDISSYNLSAYRQQIGVVPQEVMLFGGSVKENIAYGKPGATFEELEQAARKSNSLEFIDRLPQGWDTEVGERGVKLSGGQRQRIAIARAILKNPSILILDEATSSLDAESEVLVQEALNTLMEGRTTLMIAHRLSTVRKADKIVVLQAGEVLEEGTHDELARQEKGTYARLLKLQFQL
jgi:ABC-type multidrug transport system fused ATPase/permease subunit